jgi:hypothetical protein
MHQPIPLHAQLIPFVLVSQVACHPPNRSAYPVLTGCCKQRCDMRPTHLQLHYVQAALQLAHDCNFLLQGCNVARPFTVCAILQHLQHKLTAFVAIGKRVAVSVKFFFASDWGSGW